VHGAPQVPGHCPHTSQVMVLHPLWQLSPGVHWAAPVHEQSSHAQPVLHVCVPYVLHAWLAPGAQTPWFWQGPSFHTPPGVHVRISAPQLPHGTDIDMPGMHWPASTSAPESTVPVSPPDESLAVESTADESPVPESIAAPELLELPEPPELPDPEPLPPSLPESSPPEPLPSFEFAPEHAGVRPPTTKDRPRRTGQARFITAQATPARSPAHAEHLQ
jgi:hypothetical protein